LTGKEVYHIEGVRKALLEGPREATVRAEAQDGKTTTFKVVVRVDTPVEVDYYRNGGILPFVLRQLASAAANA
jgi:aconitate hydratase